MSSTVVSRSTLALTHTPAQADAWFAVTQLASRIEGLRALRREPEVTNVAPVNAKLDALQAQLTQALRAYAQA